MLPVKRLGLKKNVCLRFADRPYFLGTDPNFFRHFAEKSEKSAPSGILHAFFATTTSKQNHRNEAFDRIGMKTTSIVCHTYRNHLKRH